MSNNNNQIKKEEINVQQPPTSQPQPGLDSSAPGVDSSTSATDRADTSADTTTKPAVAPAAAVPPAPTPKPEVVVQPKAPATPAPVEQKVSKPSFTPRIAALFEDLDAYLDAMHSKKPADAKKGATNQARLFRIVQSIINSPQDEFRPAFAQLLRKFDEHGADGDTLHPLNVFRYFATIPLGDEDRMAFRNLLNLLTKTAAPKSRSLMLNQINMTATLNATAITGTGRQNVEAFFGR